MRDGFVKVAALTPEVRVADVAFNVEACAAAARQAAERDGAAVIVLPELALTGYTCEDLFWQESLVRSAEAGLVETLPRAPPTSTRSSSWASPCAPAASSTTAPPPSAAASCSASCPRRTSPPTTSSTRDATSRPDRRGSWPSRLRAVQDVPLGTDLLFLCEELPELVVAAEICEDLWVAAPPSIAHAQAGATLICNLSASNAVVGKADYRRSLVTGQSARLVCGYVYASAGTGESTQDLVFSGHDLVAENGRLLAEGAPFGRRPRRLRDRRALLAQERTRMSTFEAAPSPEAAGYAVAPSRWARTPPPARPRSRAGLTRTPLCRPTPPVARSAARTSLPSRRTASPSASRTRARARPSSASRAAWTPRSPCS